MAKVAKTAKELAKMIRARIAEPNLRIAILAVAGGWRGKIYVETDEHKRLQALVDLAVEDLRRDYDLAG
jgi:hypothetical protein